MKRPKRLLCRVAKAACCEGGQLPLRVGAVDFPTRWLKEDCTVDRVPHHRGGKLLLGRFVLVYGSFWGCSALRGRLVKRERTKKGVRLRPAPEVADRGH